MTILYTDGGCSRNGCRDLSKRKMIAVVSDEQGNVVIEKNQEGGSNNIAELLAIKEALLYCITHDIKEVEIRTDSRNNFAWVFGRTLGQKLNDRAAVEILRTAIRAARQSVSLKLVWVPRESNKAGWYIEEKYAA